MKRRPDPDRTWTSETIELPWTSPTVSVNDSGEGEPWGADPFFALTAADIAAVRRDRFRRALDERVPNRPAGQCWEWQGRRDPAGYGILGWRRHGLRREFMAHRIAYEVWIRPPHPDLVIDHLCTNKPCCNPEHLDLVTQRVNVERYTGWRDGRCRRGHELNPTNIYVHPKSGKRQCYQCNRERRGRK